MSVSVYPRPAGSDGAAEAITIDTATRWRTGQTGTLELEDSAGRPVATFANSAWVYVTTTESETE